MDTLYNSRARTCVREQMQERGVRKTEKTMAQHEKADGILRTGRDSRAGEKGTSTFPRRETYRSERRNMRTARRKHIVQEKKLYNMPQHLIKNSLTFLQDQRVLLF